MTTNPVLKEKVKNNLDANLTSKYIFVDVLGSAVTLKGIANSNHEKSVVEAITWGTAGVFSVKNELSIYNEN